MSFSKNNYDNIICPGGFVPGEKIIILGMSLDFLSR